MESLGEILSPYRSLGPNVPAECRRLVGLLNGLFGSEEVQEVCLYSLREIDQALDEVDVVNTFSQMYGFCKGRELLARLDATNTLILLEQARSQARYDADKLELSVPHASRIELFLGGLHFWRFVEQTVLPESPIDQLVLRSAPVDPSDASGGMSVRLVRKLYTVPLSRHRHRPKAFIVLRY